MNQIVRLLKAHSWLGVLFLSTLWLCLLSSYHPGQHVFGTGETSVSAQTADIPQTNTDIEQLVTDGVTRYQDGDVQAAINHWQTALTLYQDRQPEANQTEANQAIVLENLARVYRLIGHTSTAIEYWEQTIRIVSELGDVQQRGRLLTEQAQTYNQLGQYRRAIALLCGAPDPNEDIICQESSAVGLAQATVDPLGQSAALGSLGESLRLQGNYDLAITTLTKSLRIAEELNQIDYQIAALNSLGQVYTRKALEKYRRAESAKIAGDDQYFVDLETEAKANDRRAQQYLEDSQRLARHHNDLPSELRSQLSLIPLYRRLGASNQAQTAIQTAYVLLPQVPDSHEKVYSTIGLANLMQYDDIASLGTAQCFSNATNPQTETLLKDAILQAQFLGDNRGEAFALGTLGHWHECQQQYAQALGLTQQAQWVANQQRQGQDSLYLWQWQLGRILLAQDQRSEALQAYEQAVVTLDSIRNDLLISDRELQFDFRDTVEPIYRQLMSLQLALPIPSPATTNVTTHTREESGDHGVDLAATLTTLESLKLAELQNYFGSDCELVPFAEVQEGLTGTNSATAVFTSILMGDRTAIITSFANGDRQVAWIPIDEATLRETINAFRRGLESFYDIPFDTQLAEQVYNWMIRPFEQQLTDAEVKTLVFVNDGILRSIPMAALYDGQHYLIEHYAMATIPTLSLTATSNFDAQQVNALIMGLTGNITVDGQNFASLPFVSEEVDAIQNEISNAQTFLNQAFNRQRLDEALSNNIYSVLHLATHAQFGVDPDDTFLVTGQGEKLSFAEMERLIRSRSSTAEPIELLALTACETAIGDDRAALGLGGVAVRAGAKSAIASLWSINDEATARLSAQFYRGLVSEQLGKAKALQAAQTALIQDDAHPGFWAPFVLVGNWL